MESTALVKWQNLKKKEREGRKKQVFEDAKSGKNMRLKR